MAESRRDDRATGERPSTSNLSDPAGVASLPLEQRAALLSTIFASSTEGVVFIDPSLVIRAANERFAQQVQVPLDKIIGRPLEKVIPGWAEQVGYIYRQVRESGKPFHGEQFPFVFKDHPERGVTYWDYTVSPVYGASNTFLGYLHLHREVTRRVRDEEELQQAKKFSEQLIETANVMIIGLDLAGNIRVFNEAAAKITGYAKEELKGKNWFEVLVPKERYPRVWEYFARLAAGEAIPVSFENPILTKSGEERYISWQNSVVREDGRITGTISFGIDVTERRRVEEERERLLAQLKDVNERLTTTSLRVKEESEIARRRAAELRGVLDSMVDSVFVTDTEGYLTMVNEAGLRLLGLTSFAEVQMKLQELPEILHMRHTNGSPVRKEEMPLVRVLAGELTTLEDYIVHNPQTGRDAYVRTSAASIRDESGRIIGAVTVARDVTELVELDQLKDEFISIAAHELKTPIAIMKGYAQALLRTGQGMPVARRNMLEAINRGADRIDRIVKDLLDISRLHIGHLEMQMEKIDLHEMVEEVVNRMALTALKHQLRILRADPVVVPGDRDRLEQVLANLLDNAIKYSPEGGYVDVEEKIQDQEAVVSVRDYGVGIPREKQGHIFERFYRAHTGTPYDYGGMGVGLYISREIIRRHGGRMWFESEEGKGSTFYFGLPLGGERSGR